MRSIRIDMARESPEAVRLSGLWGCGAVRLWRARAVEAGLELVGASLLAGAGWHLSARLAVSSQFAQHRKFLKL